MGRADSWRAFAAVSLSLMISASLAACGNDEDGMEGGDAPPLETIRGMVLQVEPESLISLAALEVQDSAGDIWRFEGRGKVVPGFTPSHLNEHKLLGQEIGVTFYREGQALVLYDITD